MVRDYFNAHFPTEPFWERRRRTGGLPAIRIFFFLFSSFGLISSGGGNCGVSETLSLEAV